MVNFHLIKFAQTCTFSFKISICGKLVQTKCAQTDNLILRKRGMYNPALRKRVPTVWDSCRRPESIFPSTSRCGSCFISATLILYNSRISHGTCGEFSSTCNSSFKGRVDIFWVNLLDTRPHGSLEIVLAGDPPSLSVLGTISEIASASA